MSLLRRLIVALSGLLVLTLGGLFLAYGQAEPCRALAVEQARRSVAGALIEPFTRAETSQLSTAACVSGLLDSWGERLTHRLR